MALSGRAWAITGSKTPANIARMVANAATSGGNGVVGSGHLRVTATPTPSGNVRINPGTAVMASRYAGAGFESYVDRNDAAVDFPITPTGSTGGRTDYLIVRVEDPAFPGQVAPADRINGPYTRFATLTTDPRVTPPAYPFVLLAKITIPANTGTITAAMIDSGPTVREMANPRNAPMTLAWNGRMDGNTNIKANELTNVNGVTSTYWLPAAIPTNYLRWEVPAWAGQFNAQYTFGNVYNNRYDCWGFVTVRLVDPANPTTNWVNLPNIDFDTTTDAPGNWSRDTWTGAGRIVIPAWARGKTVEFRPVGAKVGGNQSTTKIYLGAGSSISILGNFMESAIDESF